MCATRVASQHSFLKNIQNYTTGTMRQSPTILGFNAFVAILIFLLGTWAYDTLSESISQIRSRVTQVEYKHSQSMNDLSRLQRLIQKNEDLIFDVFELRLYEVVEATVYHAVPEQTDSTPNITADGSVINPLLAGELRYIAVSRDLHARYGGQLEFDDVVYVSSDQVSGFYVVKDLMNKRFEKRIDFLASIGEPTFKLDGVELFSTNIRVIPD